MEPELIALASTAATTVVARLATEGWEQARRGVVALWRRAHPERAETVEAELTEARAELLSARGAGDEQTERALAEEWQGRIRRLLTAAPQLAGELRSLVEELTPDTAAGPGAAQVRMTARASGHGRVYQAGRDQHITEQ